MDINIVSIYLKGYHGIKELDIFCSTPNGKSNEDKLQFSKRKTFSHSGFTLYWKFPTRTK